MFYLYMIIIAYGYVASLISAPGVLSIAVDGEQNRYPFWNYDSGMYEHWKLSRLRSSIHIFYNSIKDLFTLVS